MGRRVSLVEARQRLSLNWIAEGEVELTHHGYVVGRIIPVNQREEAINELAGELVIGPSRVDVANADGAAAQPIRKVSRGEVTLPPGVQRGVSALPPRPFPKAEQAGRKK